MKLSSTIYITVFCLCCVWFVAQGASFGTLRKGVYYIHLDGEDEEVRISARVNPKVKDYRSGSGEDESSEEGGSSSLEEEEEDLEAKATSKPALALNERPVVAILAQELSHSLQEAFVNTSHTSYIGAAYVKFIEAAGARVVPVMIDQSDRYYEMIFNSTNGLLIPGGAASLSNSGYARAGRKLYEMALKAFDEDDDYYPILGICLGFELLARLSNNNKENLMFCSSQHQPLALEVKGNTLLDSRFGQSMPQDVYKTLATEKSTINFHRMCLTPQNFTAFSMSNFWKVLATNHDYNNLEFISLMEAVRYPIWGTQYHPEKIAFEWTNKYPKIPHWRGAVHASSYHAEFFVDECRKNMHKFASREDLEQHLIYSFNATYTGNEVTDYVMEQCYLF